MGDKMRFKKGTKVEVLTQKEVPLGSWRCAEIINGNGHHYTVRYDGDICCFGKAMVERVPQKAIRPRPPSVDLTQDCMPGDVVEVFYNYSWKMATILKVSERDRLMVRLLGSAIEYKVNTYDVRARLCWRDGEWIAIGKAAGKCEDVKLRLPSSRKDDIQSQKMGNIVSLRIKGDHVSNSYINGLQESQSIRFRTLKRKSSQCHPEIEAYARRNQKIKGEKHCIRRQFNVVQQAQLPEKVDDVTWSQEMLVEKCMLPSFNSKITGCPELILERKKRGGAAGCSRSISLESHDDDSVSSSVGSCGAYGNFFHKLHRGFIAGTSEDNDSQCSDAESFSQWRFEEGTCILPTKVELTEEIHRAMVGGLIHLASERVKMILGLGTYVLV